MSASKQRPRDPDRVRHMRDATQLIISFTTGRTFQDFLSDALLRSAVERQFEILGEASAHVSPATQALWPAVEWVSIKNFRNLLAHEYFRTDNQQIWHVATHLLPDLLPFLEALFAELDQQFGPDTHV